MCHKLSKPRLQRFVSLAGCPFALMFYLAILRPLHSPPMTVVSFFSFFTAKISCYILVKMLVHKGKLQVAYKSATCNLSLWIKARTEHACLKASEFLDVHASLYHSYLLYAVKRNSFIVRLRPTPLRSVTRSVVIQTPLADVNKLILANDDSMPKYRHEKIACPCHKPSRLTLRWLASRTFNKLVLCRYSRQATASQPTHSCFYSFIPPYLYIT